MFIFCSGTKIKFDCDNTNYLVELLYFTIYHWRPLYANSSYVPSLKASTRILQLSTNNEYLTSPTRRLINLTNSDTRVYISACVNQHFVICLTIKKASNRNATGGYNNLMWPLYNFKSFIFLFIYSFICKICTPLRKLSTIWKLI